MEAEVVGIAEDAPDRTRLLDLGFVPGTVVSRLMESPLGDPIAYQVRGTVIALRSEQTARIEVRRCS